MGKIISILLHTVVHLISHSFQFITFVIYLILIMNNIVCYQMVMSALIMWLSLRFSIKHVRSRGNYNIFITRTSNGITLIAQIYFGLSELISGLNGHGYPAVTILCQFLPRLFCQQIDVCIYGFLVRCSQNFTWM